MEILLADDQRNVRYGLRTLLEQQPGMNIAGEAEGMSQLLVQVQDKKPDLLLLDWELSNIKISDIIPVLRRLSPGVKIIALSGRPESRRNATDAGVDAFVSKGDQPEKLLETINNIIVEGERK